eukprot:g5385.t1
MLGLNQYDSDSSSSSSSDEEEEAEKEHQKEEVKKVEKKKKIEKKKELPSASRLFARKNASTKVGKKRKADSNGLFVPPQTRMKRANKSTEDVT